MPARIFYEPGFKFPGTRLTVIKNLPVTRGKNATVLCRCDCGREISVYPYNVKSGVTKSCGCLGKERAREVHIRHGYAKSPLYRMYTRVQTRCYNPSQSHYKYYGGRGITFYWKGHPKEFIEYCIAHGWREGLQIDRIDNDGNYEPRNIRFVTGKENVRNTSRNVVLTINGVTACMGEHAESSGIPYDTICARYYRLDWPVESLLLPLVPPGYTRDGSLQVGRRV